MFTFSNVVLAQLGGYADALVTATTGAKANLSTSNEAEIKQILDCVTYALENVTLKQQKLFSEQMKMTAADGDNDSSKSLIVEYPVVVIDDFLAKGIFVL